MRQSPSNDSETNLFKSQSAKLTDKLFTNLSYATIPFTALIAYFASNSGWSLSEVFQILCFVLVSVVGISKKPRKREVRAVLVVILIMLALFAEVFRYGMLAASLSLITILPVLAIIGVGVRFGLLIIGLSVIGLIAIGWHTIALGILPPVELPDVLLRTDEWALAIIHFLIGSSVVVYLVGSITRFQKASAEILRGQAEELVSSKARVLQSAKTAGLGFAVATREPFKIVECDETYAAMFGMTSSQLLLKEKSKEAYSSQQIPESVEVREAAGDEANGKVFTKETSHTRPDGEVRFIRNILSPQDRNNSEEDLLDVVSVDVTESHKLQQQLFKSQKLEAIGNLTGGIAHDFNNLLAIIIANLEILDLKLSSSEQKKIVNSSIDAALHASELTRSMLSFARQAHLNPTQIDLNELVRNLNSWIRRTLPTNIEIVISSSDDLWPIYNDYSVTESGLLNIILNARDAMPDGGKLTIELANFTEDADFRRDSKMDVSSAKYVLLKVSDTGVGIDDENIEKIFEPFFTTKAVGTGSGLGLSMLDGFMRQSGGFVSVHSELSVGTTFKLYFAAAEASSIGKVTMEEEPVEQKLRTTKHDAKILLVDDNPDLLKIYKSMLEISGYRVETANTGDEAYSVYEQNQDVGLLITDIMMPGVLQGASLAKALRALTPSLPVIFISGYSAQDAIRSDEYHQDDIHLMKPIPYADLLQSVERVFST